MSVCAYGLTYLFLTFFCLSGLNGAASDFWSLRTKDNIKEISIYGLAAQKGHEKARGEWEAYEGSAASVLSDGGENKTWHQAAENCDQSSRKILEIDSTGLLVTALSEFCSVGRRPDGDLIKTLLRFISINYPESFNRALLQDLKRSDIGLPRFILMYEKEILWAAHERAKSPEDLFTSAHSLPSFYKERWVVFFKEIYLILAAQKGHEEAARQLQEIKPQLSED